MDDFGYYSLMNGLIDSLLDDLGLVVRVADAGGFTAAARQTGIPQTTISRRIASLEQRLGVRVFDRTTRRVALTDAGRQIHEHARLMLEQAEQARLAVTRLRAAPTGRLRITAPVILGQAFVADIVAAFMARYPDVRVLLELTGRVVDLVHEGFDVAIRIGDLPDSALALTRLGAARTGLFAAAGYLAARGMPRAPADLARHAMLVPGLTLGDATVTLSDGTATETVTVTQAMVSNDVVPLIRAAEAECGIAVLPTFAAPPSLRPVLPAWRSPPIAINALTPSSRGSLPSVRAFLDMATEQLRHAATGAG